VYALGFGAGLLGLLYATRWWKPRPRTSIGPGAMAAAETATRPLAAEAALRTGMAIAVGIGLHNFSEGLAIGQAATTGEVSLALLLIIGFALHNATEGFGIVGPLAAAEVRPSWGWLGLAGLIGGGPTFLGTVVGTWFDSVYVFVGCLALAAGAILYVLGELLPVGRRLSWEITLWPASCSAWPPTSSSSPPAADPGEPGHPVRRAGAEPPKTALAVPLACSSSRGAWLDPDAAGESIGPAD